MLENEGKLLVDRHKTDNHPKSVWANDPTLIAPIGPELISLWHRVEKESHEFITNELRSRGMSSAGSDAVLAAKMVKKEKPKQKVRRGGKVTNTSMIGILRVLTLKRTTNTNLRWQIRSSIQIKIYVVVFFQFGVAQAFAGQQHLQLCSGDL